MKHENPAIFINYRRALSTLEARLLYLMLELHFPGKTFMDEQTLEGGDRWQKEIKRCVENARVMICLIPEDWVSYAGELVTQSKLCFDPDCHVRREIRTALESGVTIIPVLVNGAKQPKKEHLPKEICELFDTFNNAAPLDFKENPDVAAFGQFFEQVGKKAGLEQNKEGYDAILFSKLLDEEFPLPPVLAQLLPEAESPFVGLRPFHREDARIFFGRSREIFHLCFKVVREKKITKTGQMEEKNRIFLLDGYSGTGKSSLLQAGLIPRVEAQGWAVRYRRREEDPIHGLKGVLKMLLQDVADAPEANKLLILDQVEEAITGRIEGLPNELEEMAQALKDAYLNNPGYKFILSFRSEQMARVTKVLDRMRLPYDKENTLHQLDFLGATEAISGAANDPALSGKYKLKFSPESLPEDIARRLLKGWDNYHIAPLVQVNMELLWERCRQPDGTAAITHHALENIIDRQDGLLGHFIKKVRETIPEAQADEQKVLQLLDQYVQDEPASATRLDGDLFAQEVFRQEKVFQGLHYEFKKQYLLTEISIDGQKATRLSHDVLAKVIRERYQVLTEAKLKETTEGYFNELKKKLEQQIYQLQYLEANATLEELLQLGIRREELQPFLHELTFFWAETNFDHGSSAGFWIQKWLESNLLSDSLKTEGANLPFPLDKTKTRQWLKRIDPNRYDDLLKKYYAPAGSVMVKIPGGKGKIGEGEEERLADVSSFRLANVPVTWWKYGLFLFAVGRNNELVKNAPNWGINGNHPVVNVHWYDAVEYCNWLSEAQGLEKAYRIDKSQKDPNNTSEYDDLKWLVERIKGAGGYRLPTEVEWEFAARGGLKSKGFKYAGSDNLDEVGWYTENANSKTHPVGQKIPNELGLYDMSGNVDEWCWDWYVEYPKTLPKDFSGAVRGTGRVLRGGAWSSSDDYCRSAYRDSDVRPNDRFFNVGWRPAQDL